MATPADETSAPPAAVESEAVPPATEAAPDQESGQLPRTAGSLPLVGMVGAAAVGAAVGIGFLRRRHRA